MRTKNSVLLLSLYLVLNVLTGCDQSQTEVSPMSQDGGPSMGFAGTTRGKMVSMNSSPDTATRSHGVGAPLQGGDGDLSDSTYQQKKIIKNGSVTLTVTSLKAQTEAKEFIYAKAKSHKVTFDREDESRWGNQSNLNLTARVPADRFEDFLSALTSGPYTLSNRSVFVNEVTERYIDLEVRLKNKKQLQEKYNLLLKRADKVKDVLEINKSIESVTSDIESLEGQFKYLKNQIAFSVLNISINAELPDTMKMQNGFLQDVGLAIHTGLSRVRSFTVFVVSIWPFVLIVAIVMLTIRVWLRRRKSKGY